ncbi:hypothetical protein [Bacillus thuringiensis]|uniref:Uncharacterized protein n=1 Tax=Bacillus thuringiensis TaxID=1428 RepID=A0A9X6TJN2_BACTU|nr:hypothetical protein [Bacillus thuringiensis]PEA87494.1 hypothetical protein CON71_24070 [Bacillus thuringiensis]
MRKVEITVEERIKRKISYDFNLPDHVSEIHMNIIIARVERRSDCADDVVHLLQKEIHGLKVRKIDETDLNFDDAEIISYDIKEN